MFRLGRLGKARFGMVVFGEVYPGAEGFGRLGRVGQGQTWFGRIGRVRPEWYGREGYIVIGCGEVRSRSAGSASMALRGMACFGNVRQSRRNSVRSIPERHGKVLQCVAGKVIKK